MMQFDMSESNDHSSELQRKFAEASRLESEASIREYLDRECQDNEQEKELLLLMLHNRAASDANPLLIADLKLRGIGEAVSSISNHQQYKEHSVDGYPEVPRHRIISVLGEGAMGTVYRAEQLEPIQREVALKIIKPGMDSRQVLARFDREKQILAMLDHPQISKVFDAGMTANGYPYFSMELVRGETIEKHCANHELSIESRVRLMIDVCRATHHAHTRGIIHRDLKPSNVLVKIQDQQPLIVVIDFGVAKALESDLSQPSYDTYFRQLVGTPLYMSPEQLDSRRRDIDARSDVYSLGALLYKLLTGFTPKEPLAHSDKRDERMEPIRAFESICPSRRIRSLASTHEAAEWEQRVGVASSQRSLWIRQIKGDLEHVIMTALETSPQDRYSSAEDLASDLLNFVDGRPLFAKRSSRLKRTVTRIAKRKSILAVAAGIVLLLVAGKQMLATKDVPAKPVEEYVTNAETRAQNELEASSLRNRIRAFSEHNLHGLNQFSLPKDEAGQYLGSVNIERESTLPTGSLRKLLESLGTPLPILEMDNGSAVSDISLSPDHRYLIVACEDRFARIWSLETGEQIGQVGPHFDGVTAVLFSPDGTKFISGDREGAIAIWDLNAVLQNWPNSLSVDGSSFHTTEDVAGPESFAWSPDGSKIAVGFRYEPVVLRSASGEYLSKFDLGEPYGRNESLQFTPDSECLFLVNRQYFRIEKRRVDTHELVWASKPGISFSHDQYPRNLVSRNECLFHSFREAPLLAQVDLVTGQYAGFVQLEAPFVNDVSFSPNGKILVTVNGQGRIVISDVIDQREEVTLAIGETWIHAGDENENRIPPRVVFVDDQKFVTSGNDGRVCLWNVHGLDAISEFSHVSSNSVLIDSRGEMVEFQFKANKTIVRWRGVQVDEGAGFQLELPYCTGRPGKDGLLPYWVGSIDFSAIGYRREQQLLAFPITGGIQIWDMRSRTQLGHVGFTPIISRLAFSTDGQYLVMETPLSIVLLKSKDGWKNNELVAEFDLADFPPRGKGWKVAICDDGKSLLVCCSNCVVIADVATGKLLKTYDFLYTLPAQQFEFSASEKLVVIMDDNGFRVIDRDSDAVVLKAQDLPCLRAQFSDNERVLLTQSQPNQIQAWHLPTASSLGVLYQSDRGWQIRDFYLTPQSKLVVVNARTDDASVRNFVTVGF